MREVHSNMKGEVFETILTKDEIYARELEGAKTQEVIDAHKTYTTEFCDLELLDVRILKMSEDKIDRLYRELPEHVTQKEIQDKVTEILSVRHDHAPEV